MKTTCKICGIVEKPHKCPHSKRKLDRTRADNKVYESKQYRKARKNVLAIFDNNCLWSLFVDGKIRKTNVTHHIIEILEDESKSADTSNLIPLTEANHKLVHRLYLIDKTRIQELLRKMILDYNNGDIELGKYKSILSLYTPHF